MEGEKFIRKLLVYFSKNLPKFLYLDRCEKCETLRLVDGLRDVLEEEGEYGSTQAKMLKRGRKLIKHILKKSIKYFSINGFDDKKERTAPFERSVKSVKEYINSFAQFEEFLFGIKLDYRDHLLHSLWVYLLGHEFIREMYGYEKMRLVGQAHINYTYTENRFSILHPEKIEEPKDEEMETYFGAMWAMIALLHDFGYPIQTISNKLPQMLSKVLDSFAIDFSSVFQVEVGSRIALLHESVSDCLSRIIRPKGLTEEEDRLLTKLVYKGTEGLKEDEKKLLKLISRPSIKKVKNGLIIYRPREIVKSEEQEYEFKIASIRKLHSAWSAVYAFYNIAYLHAGSIKPGGGHDYLHLLTVKDILYSIVHHTNEEPQDLIITRFQFVLLLMDDIEEAVRYSKGGELRGSELNRCGLDWELKTDEAKVEIELDYKKEQIAALNGQKEALEKKYKHQICQEKKCNECEKKKRWSEKYKIIIRFLYEGKCHDELEMCLGIG